MKRIHSRCISERELCLELEAKDTILFEGEGLSWEKILSQVLRLGYSERYVVSVTLRDGAGHTRINLRPR
jgi:hypothetical protein